MGDAGRETSLWIIAREELRAIHDMQPPGFIRYHLIQVQRNAAAR